MKGLGMKVMWVEVGTARVREISSGEATEELWGGGVKDKSTGTS